MRLNRKGFTLVEVIAVLVIITILGLIAVPSVLTTIDNGKKGSYNIVIENIKTAAVSLYEELEWSGSSVIVYNADGTKKTDEMGNAVLVFVNEQKMIEVNLQTLLNNGFLKGTNSEDETDSKGIYLFNPMTNEDMGDCEIVIQKTVDSNSKVTYMVSSMGDKSYCPKTEEYQNGVE